MLIFLDFNAAAMNVTCKSQLESLFTSSVSIKTPKGSLPHHVSCHVLMLAAFANT